MSLTAPRDTRRRDGVTNHRALAAGARIFAGALVALNAAGFLVRGSEALNLRADGVARESVDNTGGLDGAKLCKVEPGVYHFENSAAADAITRADIRNDCFIVTDQRVARTNGGNTRSIAGRIVDVDAQGVWVRVG